MSIVAIPIINRRQFHDYIILYNGNPYACKNGVKIQTIVIMSM